MKNSKCDVTGDEIPDGAKNFGQGTQAVPIPGTDLTLNVQIYRGNLTNTADVSKGGFGQLLQRASEVVTKGEEADALAAHPELELKPLISSAPAAPSSVPSEQ